MNDDLIDDRAETARSPRAKVRFKTDYFGRQVQGCGIVYDISTTGALIEESEHLLMAGGEVRLKFSFYDGSTPVEIDARVARETDKGFAVHFLEMNARTRNLLKVAISRALSRGPLDDDEDTTLMS